VNVAFALYVTHLRLIHGKYFSWYALHVWIKLPNPIIIIRFGKNEGYLMIGRIEKKTAVIAVK
jgi:hypothetical protein